jgi:dTDP-4-dehydrorhamnose reductase
LKALVTGAQGQLGRELLTRLADAAAVTAAVRSSRPDVVINASAYNKVDAAESDPAIAFAVNASGVLHLARAAAEVGALFVHVSTDYVFDGTEARPYVETDVPRPINVYGISKRAGEMMIETVGAPSLVVRTSGVFGPGGSRSKGGSFVDRIHERARRGAPLRVVGDQLFSPTYAPDLAAAVVALIDHGARGLVHVTNEGACSWHDLAVAGLQLGGVRADVERITTADLGAAARRPACSVLSNARSREIGAALAPLARGRGGDAARMIHSRRTRLTLGEAVP